LIAELDRRIQAYPQYKDIGLGSLPSILPFLLHSSDPRDARDLLNAAKGLRADSLIAEYRSWRKELLHNWIDKGYIEESHENNVKRVALEIHRRLDVDKHFELELGLKGIGLDPGITVAVPVPIGRIWGWILEQLPGRGRYMKVLMRLKLADQRYIDVGPHLERIWQNS
jgi:hypothetical protein